jgi:hypothetical protein
MGGTPDLALASQGGVGWYECFSDNRIFHNTMHGLSEHVTRQSVRLHVPSGIRQVSHRLKPESLCSFCPLFWGKVEKGNAFIRYGELRCGVVDSATEMPNQGNSCVRCSLCCSDSPIVLLSASNIPEWHNQATNHQYTTVKLDHVV